MYSNFRYIEADLSAAPIIILIKHDVRKQFCRNRASKSFDHLSQATQKNNCQNFLPKTIPEKILTIPVSWNPDCPHVHVGLDWLNSFCARSATIHINVTRGNMQGIID